MISFFKEWKNNRGHCNFLCLFQRGAPFCKSRRCARKERNTLLRRKFFCLNRAFENLVLNHKMFVLAEFLLRFFLVPDCSKGCAKKTTDQILGKKYSSTDKLFCYQLIVLGFLFFISSNFLKGSVSFGWIFFRNLAVSLSDCFSSLGQDKEWSNFGFLLLRFFLVPDRVIRF